MLIGLGVAAVVIGLIALITSTVVISNARSKVRDEQRKADLVEIQAAMELYHQKFGSYRVEGGGYNGSGSGWLTRAGVGAYGTSVVRRLQQEGYLDNIRRFEDPLEGPGYMLYTCNKNQEYSISATLENPTGEDVANIKASCNGSGGNGTYTKYDKNYSVNNVMLKGDE